MNIGQAITLIAFIGMLLASIVAGTRMWRLHQRGLAMVCGMIATFIFMLGFWFLTTPP
ncbi:MAG: hypothetical protein QM753_17770 [Thermomicrobiales bacterium]